MNRPAVLSLLIALAALPASAPATSLAQDDLQSLQAQYRDEQVRARRLRADARDAQAEINALDRELAGLRRDQTADDYQLSAQRQRLRDLGRREADS
jgi:Skp family chaperone for outer membrane proteins